MSRAGLDAESPEINEGIAQIWDNRHGPIWPEAVRLAQRACMTELLQFRMKPLADGRRTELSYGDPVAEVDTQGLGNPPAARVEDES